MYSVQIDADIWVIHAFQKKSKSGIKTPKAEMDLILRRLKQLRRHYEDMSDDVMELVRGSGNVFRDLGDPNPELEQLRVTLAARIIGVLDDRGLSTRRAGELTGIAAADFSRIRRANLGRFTIDRLMTILARLDQKVDVTVSVRPRTQSGTINPARRYIHDHAVAGRRATSISEKFVFKHIDCAETILT